MIINLLFMLTDKHTDMGIRLLLLLLVIMVITIGLTLLGFIIYWLMNGLIFLNDIASNFLL